MLSNYLNKIHRQDCFEGVGLLPDGCIDLICTDPPYDLRRIGGGGSIATISGFKKSLNQLEESGIINGYDIEAFAQKVERLQYPNINAYFFCNKNQIPEYLRVYAGKLKCKFDLLCWHKPNAIPTYFNKYLTDTEYILYFRRGRGKCFPQSYSDAFTYFLGSINAKDKELWKHPTIKPIGLIERFIRNSSTVGDIVLDPFIGSGTTAVASVKLQRRYIGFENNPQYYQIACNRVRSCKMQATIKF